MNKFLIFFLLFCTQSAIYAQYQIGIIPRVSPDKKIYQKIGNTSLEICYGSPALNERKVWGELVPFNKVWRAGANSATTVEFNSDVLIGGQVLDSGKYSFFILPKEDGQWTVIFNKVARQWGAFKYNQDEDALRIEINPIIKNESTENLTYTIEQEGFKKGSIILKWDKVEIEVPFETNYIVQFEDLVNSRAIAQPDYIKWIPYLQGAEHLEELQENLALAQKWIKQAEEIMDSTTAWNDQFYPRDYIQGHLYWTKAKIYAWNSDFKGAVKAVDQLKSIKESTFYDDQNESERIDFQLESWKKKI